MKYLLALISICILCSPLSSQSFNDFAFEGEYLAVINDPDGYTNVRKAPSTQAEIIAKIYDGELFQVYQEAEDAHNWYEISFEKEEGKSRGGFIHKSRVLYMKDFPQMEMKDISKHSVTFVQENAELRIISAPFDPSSHQINRAAGGWVKDINGKYAWGTDGGLPTSEIKSIIFKVGNKSLPLPQEAFLDTFQPNFKSARVIVAPNGLICLWMSNSDGAGGYDVIWVVKDGKYVKRYIGLGA